MSKRKKKQKKSSRRDAIIVLILGLVLGTVFVIGAQTGIPPVPREDAIHTSAVFESYNAYSRRRGSDRMYVRFDDCEQLDVPSLAVNRTLKEKMDSIPSGTRVSLIVHPKTDTILEMRAMGDTLLAFDETSRIVMYNACGYLFLGIICYLVAVNSVIWLITQKKRR